METTTELRRSPQEQLRFSSEALELLQMATEAFSFLGYHDAYNICI
jgi:histone H3/H4